eukprot:10086304-Lingulodinium_polyedra.AAC.1
MMNYYDRAQWDFRVDDRLTQAMAYGLGLYPTEKGARAHHQRVLYQRRNTDPPEACPWTLEGESSGSAESFLAKVDSETGR